MRKTIWLLFPLFCFSCSIKKGLVKYAHTPLYEHEDVIFIPKTKEDSFYLKTNQRLVSPGDELPLSQLSIKETYLFQESLVRVKRKTRIKDSDKFHLYFPDEMKSVIYKAKNKGIVVDTLLYDWRANPDWTVDYDIVERRKGVKKILGYKCNFTKIIETKTTASGTNRFLYEIYSTPSIRFPLELACGLSERLYQECPLEITITDLKCPKYYSKILAAEVGKEADDLVFELPDKFIK